MPDDPHDAQHTPPVVPPASDGGTDRPTGAHEFPLLADDDEPLPAFLRRLDARATAQPDTIEEPSDAAAAKTGAPRPLEGTTGRAALSAEALAVASTRVRAGAALALRETLTLGAVLAVVVGVAAAFVWPWLGQRPAGGERLARYSPVRDGDARLIIMEAGDGSVRGWTTQNTRLIPGLRIYTDLRKAIGDGFMASLLRPGETAVPDDELRERLAALVIQETRIYELDAEGSVTETWQYFARDEQGDRFVGLYYPQTDRDIIADPPALTLPSSAEAGDTWSGAGKLGNGGYTWTGRVISEEVYDGAAGRLPDCLQVEQRVAIGVGATPVESLSRDWFCEGIGWVEGQTLEEDGTLKQRTYWLAASGELLADAPLPLAAPTLTEQPIPADADRWHLTRLGRTRPTGETSEATILPTWLPIDPPLVLAAGFAGDLVAFETATPGAPARWRFHPGGTVYGQPAFDADAGRIYVGASDKRLYALDTRGLFLWSFETKDNVAARPLVVGDLVVAASEDGKAYGLDATTGRARWTFKAEGGIVSWPLTMAGVVVVGSDDRTVYGIDPTTGTLRWTLLAGGAVEAPITPASDSGVAYVASRDGTLAAFRPADCMDICEALWSEKPGASLRTAPLVAGDRVVVVDQDGELLAVRADRE